MSTITKFVRELPLGAASGQTLLESLLQMQCKVVREHHRVSYTVLFHQPLGASPPFLRTRAFSRENRTLARDG